MIIINGWEINCPVDTISKDYFLNQQGAKVYFDISKQPLLYIPKGRIVCDVLSVGCSRELIPFITIEEACKSKCYRLPNRAVRVGNDFSWFC